jgi:hypothetical protein
MNDDDPGEMSDAELCGTPLSDEEMYGKFSPAEFESAAGLMREFRVELISEEDGMKYVFEIMTESSCDAVMAALDAAFPDFEGQKPTGGLRVSVELVEKKPSAH